MAKTSKQETSIEDVEQEERLEEESLDAVALLQADHALVEDLFSQFEQAGDRDEQGAVAQEIFQALEAHTQLEEEIFYPAVQAQVYEGEDALLEASRQDHQQVKTKIQQLRRLQPEDSEYQALFQDLMSDVRAHVAQEEDEMLPDAEEQLGEELIRLGAQMRARKQELMAAAWETSAQNRTRITLLQSLEAILIAELADHEGWEMLTALAQAAGEDQLAGEFAHARATEQEHLTKVRSWLAAGQGRTS